MGRRQKGQMFFTMTCLFVWVLLSSSEAFVSKVSSRRRYNPLLLSVAPGSQEPNSLLTAEANNIMMPNLDQSQEQEQGQENEQDSLSSDDQYLLATSSSPNQVTMEEELEELEDDPYSGMLSLDKPIKPASMPLSEWTIKHPSTTAPNSPNTSLPRKQSATLAMITRNKSASMAAKKALREKMNFWDDFLEKELGDLDAELEEKDKWIYEMRDYIEKQKGFPIWSKRSEQEIAREMRKANAERGLSVPANVAKVIQAVYLEKSQTMKQFKAQDELSYMEFRKWMSETRRKTKKDPLPQAKVSVSKKWLMQPPSRYLSLAQLSNPSSSFSSSSSKSSSSLADVPVLLDENMKNSEGVPRGTSLSTTTQSMRDWMKTKQEMNEAIQSSSLSSSSASSTSTKKAKQLVFEIDDTEMFVPSSLVDMSSIKSNATRAKTDNAMSEDETPDYFVVL